jgi:hypothetical protein
MIRAMRFLYVSLLSSITLLSGCVHVRTDPIQVEPIHITVDVYVRVDQALEDFFRDIDASSGTIEP